MWRRRISTRHLDPALVLALVLVPVPALGTAMVPTEVVMATTMLSWISTSLVLVLALDLVLVHHAYNHSHVQTLPATPHLVTHPRLQYMHSLQTPFAILWR